MVEVSRRAVVVVAGGSAVTAAAGVVVATARSGSGPDPGRPVRTSFGSVAVVSSSRIGTSTGATGHGAHDAHVGAAAPAAADALVASAVHGAWRDGVVVEVEVHNRLRRPVGLSPGQFRVRVDRAGPTVSLYSSDRDAAQLEAGASRRLRITYLAPSPDRRLSLEFQDTGSTRVVALGAVGDAVTAGARS